MRQPARPPVNPEAIEEMLTVRSSKWTVTVVLHLRRETLRFTELQRDIGGISQKALTATLRALERDGFVIRTSYATIPPRVDYQLSELGFEILQLFEGFESFAGKHWHRVMEARRAFDDGLADAATVELFRTGTGR